MFLEKIKGIYGFMVNFKWLKNRIWELNGAKINVTSKYFVDSWEVLVGCEMCLHLQVKILMSDMNYH